MLRVSIWAAAFAVVLAGSARADEPIKVGLIQSLTGPFNMVGKAAVDGAKLYVQRPATTR